MAGKIIYPKDGQKKPVKSPKFFAAWGKHDNDQVHFVGVLTHDGTQDPAVKGWQFQRGKKGWIMLFHDVPFSGSCTLKVFVRGQENLGEFATSRFTLQGPTFGVQIYYPDGDIVCPDFNAYGEASNDVYTVSGQISGGGSPGLQTTQQPNPYWIIQVSGCTDPSNPALTVNGADSSGNATPGPATSNFQVDSNSC